jgi:hypothetical protein
MDDPYGFVLVSVDVVDPGRFEESVVPVDDVPLDEAAVDPVLYVLLVPETEVTYPLEVSDEVCVLEVKDFEIVG